MGLSYEEAVAAVTAPGAPFAIREELVRGRRMKVFERTPPSLRAFFQATRAHGEREFLVYEDERWSLARVHAQADAIGALLAGRYGVRPGDRVAIPGPQLTLGRAGSALDLRPGVDPLVEALALHVRTAVDAVLGRGLPVPDVLPELVVIRMEDVAMILRDRERT